MGGLATQGRESTQPRRLLLIARCSSLDTADVPNLHNALVQGGCPEDPCAPDGVDPPVPIREGREGIAKADVP